MANFQKRHYEIIAQVLREVRDEYELDPESTEGVYYSEALYAVEDKLVEVFQTDNRLFKADRFRKYAS